MCRSTRVERITVVLAVSDAVVNYRGHFVLLPRRSSSRCQLKIDSRHSAFAKGALQAVTRGKGGRTLRNCGGHVCAKLRLPVPARNQCVLHRDECANGKRPESLDLDRHCGEPPTAIRQGVESAHVFHDRNVMTKQH